jgi:hypothetical protein
MITPPQGRVWILQEIINAKNETLHAGLGNCSWDSIGAITKRFSMYDAAGCINIAGTICSLSTVEMIWNLSRLKEGPRNTPLPCLLDVLVDSI